MSTADILVKLKEFRRAHAAEYGISRVGLFGSYARGVARPESDVDVVIEIGKTDLFILAGIKAELETLLSAPVDLVPYGERMNAFLKQRIDRDVMYA
jgi:predicted nucleotidyltransferase